jgi:hypothetical protein
MKRIVACNCKEYQLPLLLYQRISVVGLFVVGEKKVRSLQALDASK